MLFGLLATNRPLDNGLVDLKQGSPGVTKLVKGASFYKGFDGALIEHCRGNLFDKIMETHKCTL
ncbi:unannotated protein [freshwater metagenome]|uniref:Unannotated protein n=1 Tax=freshwater metagenome TaxID=449393 RepID=A0A6J6K466_9ZZZZ